MIRKLRLKFTLTTLAFFIGFLTVSAQVSLREISLKEQLDNSSLVIEGKVIAKRTFWDVDRKSIYTANTVEVYKVFKGDAVETIEILTQGGIVGLEAVLFSHALKLGKGSLGIFTLYDSNVSVGSNNMTQFKQYKTYSSIQGFYKYDLQNDLATNTFNKRKGITTSFYNDVVKMTKRNYIEVSSFDIEKLQKKQSQKNSLFAPTNITFTPTVITAGTGSVLTINGSGFGANKGKVGFRDSDDGGATFFNAFDTHVISWSDTQIIVEVPTINSDDTNIAGTAGTGTIRVTHEDTSSNTSAATLTISYAEQNIPGDRGVGLGNESWQTQHYGANNSLSDGFSGGYTWEMFTTFFNDTGHPGAKDAFMKAFDSWRCETKVNWEISTSATTISSSGTAEHVIMFDDNEQLGAGVLGTCKSGYLGRLLGGVIYWYVVDLDIIFDSETSWYFGSNGEVFDSGEFDFETVALHELGHGHQLGHVINPSNVMHYALPPNTTNTTLDANSIAGANDVQSRSTTNKVPGTPDVPLMTNYAGTCGLSVEDNNLENTISLYPNPTKQQFFIKSTSVNLDKVEIYDVSGRLISEIDVSDASRTIPINLIGASKGMYFVNIHSDTNFITKKLVLE